jgi:hypothetical protein
VAFQQIRLFDTSNTKIPLSDSEAVPFSQAQVVENAARTVDFRRFVQPMIRNSQSSHRSADINYLRRKIDSGHDRPLIRIRGIGYQIGLNTPRN